MVHAFPFSTVDLSSVVIRDPFTAQIGTTVMAAIAQMDGRRHCFESDVDFSLADRNGPDECSCCIVVMDQDTVVGLITERDIVRLSIQVRELDQLTVGEMMMPPLAIIKQSMLTNGYAILRFFQQHRVSCLPVVDRHDRLVGVITYEGVLSYLVQAITLHPLEPATEEAQSSLPYWKLQPQTQTEQILSKQREALVAQIANRIRGSLHLQTILATCVTEIRTFLNCDRVLICQLQPNGQADVMAESTALGWSSMIANSSCGSCHPQFPTLTIDDIPVGIDNIHTMSHNTCQMALLEQYSVKSTLVVPIQVSGKRWGILMAHQCSDYRHWQPGDKVLFQDMAVQLAIAIQQATTQEHLQTELRARQQAEVKLLEVERRYANLAEIVPVGIFQTDTELQNLYINEHCSQLIGCSPLEAAGDGWFKHLHPDDRDRVLTTWKQAIQSGCPFQLEYRFCHPDGMEVWVYGQCIAEHDATGQLIGYVGTLTDITQRKQAELRLQCSERQNRAFLSAIPDLIVQVGADGNYRGFVSWNRSLSLEPDEVALQHKNIVDILPPEAAKQQLHYLQKALDSGNLQVFEQQIERSGCIHFEEVRIIKCGDDEALFIVRDVSDRRQLEQTTQFLASIVESSGDAIITKNLDGIITSWNAAAEQLFGYTNAEAVGQPITLLFPPERHREEQEILKCIKQGDRFTLLETVRHHKDGRRIDVAITVSPLWNRDGQLVGASKIARDITQRKQAESQLHEASQRLFLATESAQLGIWDWDLIGNHLAWDERMYELYGVDPLDFSEAYEAWRQGLHPADLAAAETLLQQAIAGDADFHTSFRIFWPDGQVRHISAHAIVIRNDQGIAERVIGVNWDITSQKRAEAQLETLVTGTVATTGQDFLAALVEHIAQTLEVPHVAVSLLDGDQMHTLAFWSHGSLQPNISYYHAHTPCRRTLDEGRFFSQSTVQQDFPLDQDLVDMGVNSYLGVALCSATGQTFGLLCVLSPDPICDPQRTEQILQIFAARTAAELERQQAIASLEQLNQSLEGQVADRTAALLERELRYGALMERASDGILLCDRHGKILEVNHKVEEWLGYDRAELTSMPLTQLHPPENRAKILVSFEQVVNQQRTQVLDVTFLTKSGTLLPIDISASVLEIQGQFIVQAILRDIRERKRLEAERERAEGVIRQQAEQERLLGEITRRIRQSLNLQTIFDTACQEIRPFLRAERVGIFQFDLDSNYETGEFVAESVVHGFISVVGKLVHDHCFGRDHANHYAKGRYLVADDVCYNRFSPCHADILLKLQVRACMVMPLICGEQLWGLLCIHQCTAPRSWEAAEISLSQRFANQLAIAIQQAKLYEQVQQELAERQQAQQLLTERNQQLALSNEELARATRLKDEFLANMSHELRTPLNAILGLTEGLHDQVFGPVTPEQRKTFQTIERSGSHLLELINDILDVAKIESGQMEIDCVPTSVRSICQSSLTFVKQQALKKRIQMETVVPAHIPHIYADERRIRQVLINLLNNAVKFTPEHGQITLEVRYHPPNHPFIPIVVASLDQASAHYRSYDCATASESSLPLVSISVIDTGIGIVAEHLDRLFQPFVQIDSALNRHYSGTGLGLALVKRIVELHNGAVSVVSEAGVGSCFTFTIPCELAEVDFPEPQGQPQLGEMQASTVVDGPTTNPLILLAEDNDANVSTISSYLKARGYQMVLAGNGQEAIALTQKHHPDLILMDIQMPQMDGFEAIQQIRAMAEFEQVPIVALTALAMATDRDRCFAVGANEYISKPVKLKQLVNTIQQCLHHLPSTQATAQPSPASVAPCDD
ncbi:MAG: PAS domain S-box protein [Leptolyngbyaceae bacterium]|nr:PAS domain S-box protein [Leptolyngbyaceae bacterium]